MIDAEKMRCASELIRDRIIFTNSRIFVVNVKGLTGKNCIRGNGTMKVLTIKQPWATLIMQRDKRFEFRSWQTKYRGDLLIHAGKGIDKEAIKRFKEYLPEELPFGKILGKVTLVDCIRISPEFKESLLKENKDIYTKSSFKENFGWQMDNVQAFKEPIEAKGHLSLWEYDIENYSHEK